MGQRELPKDHDIITYVFWKDLPGGPMEDAQERASRKQHNQLTGWHHIPGMNDYSKKNY